MTIAFQQHAHANKRRQVKVTRYGGGFTVRLGIVRPGATHAHSVVDLQPTQLRYLITILQDALQGALEAQETYSQSVAQSDATDHHTSPRYGEPVASGALSEPEENTDMRE